MFDISIYDELPYRLSTQIVADKKKKRKLIFVFIRNKLYRVKRYTSLSQFVTPELSKFRQSKKNSPKSKNLVQSRCNSIE